MTGVVNLEIKKEEKKRKLELDSCCPCDGGEGMCVGEGCEILLGVGKKKIAISGVNLEILEMKSGVGYLPPL